MRKLRTPKSLPGPELGIPALGFQAWYEARHGEAAYDAIDRIARVDWADYLDWYGRILNIPIRFSTQLRRIEPADGYLRLHLDVNGSAKVETARKVILANGFLGGGGSYVPSIVADNLPQSLYAHTADAINFAALRGKAVAVVGAAAAAFDAAATAIEAGAKTVDLFVRRAAIPARAGDPCARLSWRLRQLFRSVRCGALASSIPVSISWFDASGRCYRACGEPSQFPPASCSTLDGGASRRRPNRGRSRGAFVPV